MNLDDIQPTKVYLDASGCKSKHDPCLRYFVNGRCMFCGREAKRRKSHLVGEDRYCERCGEPLPLHSQRLLCPDCFRALPQWGRGTVFLCVEGADFLGRRFRKDEVHATTKFGFWDRGMVFEEYLDRKYIRAWAVENEPQELVPVRGHVQRGFV